MHATPWDVIEATNDTKDVDMTDLERFTRRRITGLLAKYRIDDESLEAELIEACWAVRSWQPDKPAERKDGRVALVERVTGFPVPPALYSEVAALAGDASEDVLRKAYTDWRLKGRDPKAYTWLKWAAHVGKGAQAASGQQAPAGFTGLEDWLHGRA